MAHIVILCGLGAAVVGFGGRALYRRFGPMLVNLSEETIKELSGSAGAKFVYYRGGFESKMTRTEAGRILGVSPYASLGRTRQAHKRLMLLNHPDRGGSPYLATKINEAKDLLEKQSGGFSSNPRHGQNSKQYSARR